MMVGRTFLNLKIKKINWNNFKLGVVIAWTISIVKKNSVAIAKCLQNFFFALISQLVYTECMTAHNITVQVQLALLMPFQQLCQWF